MREMLPVTSILLIFYLAMLFKWSSVRRPAFYFIGAIGLLLMFIGRFFLVGGAGEDSGVVTVARVFDALGALISFVCAFLACYGGVLPTVAKGVFSERPSSREGQQ
jgi:hypothetical protein